MTDKQPDDHSAATPESTRPDRAVFERSTSQLGTARSDPGERPNEQFTDDGPQTEQIQRPVTEPSTRAYSQTPPPVAGTSQFPTGQRPGTDGFAPVPAAGPAFPPPDGSGPVRTAPSRKRRRPLTIVVASVLAVVLVLIIAGVSSELYLRHRVNNCVADAISESVGFPVDVSLSRRPILLQWINGRAPWAEVHGTGDNGEKIDARAEDVAFSGGEIGSISGNLNVKGIKLDGRAENVKGDGSDAATLGSLNATGSVNFDRIIAASKSSNSNDGTDGTGIAGGIEKITGNPADDTISVVSNFAALFMMIPVTVIVKPVLNQGHVTFAAQKVTADLPILSTIEVPANFAQQIIDQVAPQMFGSFFNEVSVTSLKVTDSGVDFALNGTDVRLDQSTATAGTGKSVNCSIV